MHFIKITPTRLSNAHKRAGSFFTALEWMAAAAAVRFLFTALFSPSCCLISRILIQPFER
jgi:hypothetical protein